MGRRGDVFRPPEELVDLTPLLPWLKYLHVAGAFLFVAGHGVSMLVAFRLRAETQRDRMLALLDLSAWSLYVAGVGMLVVLVSGLVSGVAGDYLGRAWFWAALALFIVVGGLMTPIAGMHFNRVRLALGQRTRTVKPGEPDPAPLPMEDVAVMLRSNRPELTALVGGVGFLVILWLMVFKPF